MTTRKWGSEQHVNTTTAGEQSDPCVAALAGGGFVVIWEDDGGANAVIRGQLFDAVGSKVGAEISISGPTGNIDDQTRPSVTGLSNGGFYVTWSDFDTSTDRDAVGAVFDSAGNFVRSQDAASDVTDSTQTSVARLGSGSIVTWTNGSAEGADVYCRIFNAVGTGGTVFTANTTLTDGQGEPSVAVAPDGLTVAIAWIDTSDGTIKGRLFDAAGNPAAAAETRIDAPSTALGTSDPVVTWLNKATFAVAWTQGTAVLNTDIMVRIFDGEGASPTALTGNISVNSTAFYLQSWPTITALPNGGFVVAWDDLSGVGIDDSQSCVRLQAFDGSGGKIGGEITVNTTTEGGQSVPNITALGDGRVVVSWTDSSSSTSLNDIRMQIVDPRDGIVDGTPGNDTLYGHDAIGDQISGGSGNDTLFGLKGNDDLYGGDDNDTLNGGQGDDTLYGGAGIDTADYGNRSASIAVTLHGAFEAVVTAAGLEEDSLFAVENVTGGTNADTLVGDAFANVLTGNDGNDALWGNGGADTLSGGAGADALTGGGGLDRLNGGAGNDRFIYTVLSDSGVSLATRDQISGFASADKIDVHLIDAIAGGGDNAFVLDTDGSFSQGEIRQTVTVSGHLLLEFNADADAAPDMSILLRDHTTLLGSGEFVL